MYILSFLYFISVFGLTPDEMHEHYNEIFPHHNRNAASHRWATYVLERSTEFTETEIKTLFTGFCPVSGSPLGEARVDGSRWKLILPDLGGNEMEGFVHFCCWPCVCDAHDWLKVDPTVIETKEGRKEFNFLVLGDPCKDPSNIPLEAPDVTCKDGKLEKATLSVSGFPIVGMLQDYVASKTFQEESAVLGSACVDRESDGYHSGMGTIFRDVAKIDEPSPGLTEVKLSSPESYCSPGAATSEYQRLSQVVKSSPVVLAGAVYRGTQHYRCYDAAEEKLGEEGVCHETVDISDALWNYLQCLYPNEKTNGRMMHSYLFINGDMVGNGFVVDPYMDGRFTWPELKKNMEKANAQFTCRINCDNLIDQAQREEIEKVVASQPVVMYGWESCPCVSTARTRFASRHACFVENTWTNPEDSKMKYLQCKYGHEHHSFIWFNEKLADGSMSGGKFIGNGFYFGPQKMSDSKFDSLLDTAGARLECQGLEDKSLLGQELESCTDGNDRTTTGFTRSGSCVWQSSDRGYHQVCVRMSNKFIAQSALIDKNDLSSVTSEGQHWCICAWAWASSVARDPIGFEGIKLECGRTNQRLREVYQTYINSGNDICSPGGVCYKAKAALDAVNKLCPESGISALSSPQKRSAVQRSQQIVEPIQPKRIYFLEPIFAFLCAMCLMFGLCYYRRNQTCNPDAHILLDCAESSTLKTC